MDIDDFPLSSDDKQQIDDALTKLDIYVLEQKQLVSYQWLSNELAIDALIARHALAAFIQQHSDQLDVLWLLSGRTTAVNKYGLPSQSQSQGEQQVQQQSGDGGSSAGGSNSSSYINIDEDDTGDRVKVNEITLVRDADLEAVKQQFDSITSLHPYSVAIKPPTASQPIKDVTAALYTLHMQQLLAMYDQPSEEDNALRDARYGAIVPDSHIKRNTGAALLSSVGVAEQPNGHTRDSPTSVPPLASAATSSAAAAAGGEMAGLKKAAGKSNALANMFSKQTTALKQSPLPAAARASNKAVEEPRAVQSNAATVLPAEEQKDYKVDRTGKHSKAAVDEDEGATMDEQAEDAEEAEEEDDKPASKATTSKHKPTSSSRKSKKKAKPSSSATKKKRKRHSGDKDDEFVYPYDSHSDEEKEVAEAAEEEEERYRAAAVEEDGQGGVDEQTVPSSIAHNDDERGDERMDGTEAGSRFKQFFTSQPATQSTSASLPKQRRKVQKTFLDSEGYMRVEEVEEEDEQADRQREDREREEERAREEREGKRREQREQERRDKEKAEEEERERKEKEKKEKREQKKQEKKQQAEKAKEEDTASQSGRRSKRKAGDASDDEVMEEEEKEKGGKAGKKGKKGKDDASDSGKEKPAAGKGDIEKGGEKGGKKEKSGKAAVDNKPKNNASILSFFNRK